MSDNISVHIDGDKTGFNSKIAIDKFKKSVKTNNNINIDELKNKYIKNDYNLDLINKTDTEIKFKLYPKLINNITNNEEDKKRKREMLKQKIKMLSNNRTNVGYDIAKNDNNVSDELLKLYNKLVKISKLPIPNPAEVLKNPDQYKTMISMILGNKMMKQLGKTHPYVKYFTLLGLELGIDINQQPEITSPQLTPPKLPSNINDVMKMAGPIDIKGNKINNDDTDTEDEDD